MSFNATTAKNGRLVCALVGFAVALFLLIPSVQAARFRIHSIQFQTSIQELLHRSDEPDARLMEIRQEIDYIFNNIFQKSSLQAPGMIIARADSEKREEEFSTVRSKRYSPDLSLRLSQNFDEADVSDSQGSGSSTSSDDGFYSDWDFQLNLPVYKKSLSLDLDVAELEKKLAEKNLEIETVQLHDTLKKLLGDYLTAGYQLLNLENSIALSKSHLAKIRRGYELRDQTRLELMRAEANAKLLESRLGRLQQKKDSAFVELLEYSGLDQANPSLVRLGELLGSEEDTAQCIIGLAETGWKLERLGEHLLEATDQELTDFFLKNSAMHRKMLLEYQLENHKLKKISEDEWPTLGLNGNYGRMVDTELSDFEREGSLSLVLTVPLFSGGTLRSRLATLSRAERIAEIDHHRRLRKLIHSLLDDRKLIIRLQQVYSDQQAHLEQQREIVELSLKSYAIRQTTMQDLLTSQNHLIDAKNGLMDTTSELGSLLNRFAWELGVPFPAPQPF